MNPERLFISTTPGLEPALEDELRELRLRPVRAEGGFEVEGVGGLHRRLNLELRTATRILMRIAQLRLLSAGSLAEALAGVRLDPFRARNHPVRLSVSARGAHDGRLREAAARAWGADDAGGEDDADAGLGVFVRAEGETLTVSVDTSGELLYRRGYRQEVSRAPLRETLAAGILRLAGYRGDEPLWDPLCGSGTIAIEAALIAARRAPGQERPFAFQRWPSHDAAAFESERAAARARELKAPACPIRASDVNAGSLGTARRNARRARVIDHLTLQRDDLTRPSALPPESAGLLATNPPYGKRVGDPSEVAPLYKALGAILRERLPAWRAAILVPAGPLERELALPVDDAFEVQNGGIRCRVVITLPARK